MSGRIPHRCLLCSSPHGTPIGGGAERWVWNTSREIREAGLPGQVGPFCSETCRDAWGWWPEEARLAHVFGPGAAEIMTHIIGPRLAALAADAAERRSYLIRAPQDARYDPRARCPWATDHPQGVGSCPHCRFVDVRLEESVRVPVQEPEG